MRLSLQLKPPIEGPEPKLADSGQNVELTREMQLLIGEVSSLNVQSVVQELHGAESNDQ